MAHCTEDALQPYFSWLEHQPGGLRSHVVGIRITDVVPSTSSSFGLFDVYDGVLTSYWFNPQAPKAGTISLVPKAILSGSAMLEGNVSQRVSVGIIVDWAGSLHLHLRFPANRTILLNNLDCSQTKGDLILAGIGDSEEHISIHFDRSTLWHSPVTQGVHLP